MSAEPAPVRIEIPASASPEEAAALVAAVEQFLRETTVAVDGGGAETDAWTRTARLEAVGRGASWDATAGDGLAAWAS